ncbi:urea ABC transporter permease [Sporolactobacillus shoreae]|uniref:Urea ABC transporter permease n=1 Tax=Sporolactobacillus shoreae TaxID=1465501 RepID=A0A4Z0GQ98_9BACL|nr:urea ABC transporter permease [Sporolactobacillus shoreae]TGA98498.1 urea ABC transporter permease [Sporolactobacillus shoreae]
MVQGKIKTENIVAALIFFFLFICPLFIDSYSVLNISYFLSMAFLSLSLTLIWGYCGIFSFGQAVFFGIGGYFYAVLTLNLTGTSAITPLGLLLGVILGGLAAWILGYFMFYGGVNDVFVGLITLCLTLVLSTFMGQTAGSAWNIGQVSLGGFNGINGIPALELGPISLSGNNFYYFVLIILFVIYCLLKLFTHSKVGAAIVAIRENRERTKMFGYNVPKIQSLVFAAGGALASLSGILYATWGNYITPSAFALSSATIPVVLVAAGGRKNFTASIIFTVLYYWFAQGLSASGSQYALVILGLILILVTLFVPDGIIVFLFHLSDRLFFHRESKMKEVQEEHLHEKNIG